jgi:hypothetical protein
VLFDERVHGLEHQACLSRTWTPYTSSAHRTDTDPSHPARVGVQ